MAENSPNVIPTADTIQYQHAKILIIGAGPVGLLLALKLSLQGVDVLVLEAEADLLQGPRATTSVIVHQHY